MTHDQENEWLSESPEIEGIDYDAIEKARRESSLASYNSFVAHLKELERKGAVVEIQGKNQESGVWSLNFSIKTTAANDSGKLIDALYKGTIETERVGFLVQSELIKGRSKAVRILNTYVCSVDELAFIHQRMADFRNTGLWPMYWFGYKKHLLK